jgi:predicted O-linked N-acetylglucosamine transferase (SPINDLY family)
LQSNLRREAATRGVDPARLVFAPRVTGLPQHLARHRLADLFLDTVPYNAHSTARDALWVGLPVLTVLGDSFAGRVAASLLQASSLPELVASSLEEYVYLAVLLASDEGRLSDIRGRLAAGRAASPLFDGKRQCRYLEAAFEQMLAIHRAGDAPRDFSIPSGVAGSTRA